MKAVKTQCVKNNLGLVCITTTDAVRYKTVTRKRLLSFDEATQREKLRTLYQENINRINNAINFARRITLIFIASRRDFSRSPTNKSARKF